MRALVLFAATGLLATQVLAQGAPGAPLSGSGQGPAQAPQAPANIPAAQAPVLSAVPIEPGKSGQALIERQAEGELLAGDLVGQVLHLQDGSRVGDIVDILVGSDRKLKGIIVALDVGGARKKTVGMAFEALQRAASNGGPSRLVANLDAAVLRDAKEFQGLAKEASLDDNQDLTKPGRATGGSVPPKP